MADIVSKINSKAIALKQNVSGFFLWPENLRLSRRVSELIALLFFVSIIKFFYKRIFLIFLFLVERTKK